MMFHPLEVHLLLHHLLMSPHQNLKFLPLLLQGDPLLLLLLPLLQVDPLHPHLLLLQNLLMQLVPHHLLLQLLHLQPLLLESAPLEFLLEGEEQLVVVVLQQVWVVIH